MGTGLRACAGYERVRACLHVVCVHRRARGVTRWWRSWRRCGARGRTSARRRRARRRRRGACARAQQGGKWMGLQPRGAGEEAGPPRVAKGLPGAGGGAWLPNGWLCWREGRREARAAEACCGAVRPRCDCGRAPSGVCTCAPPNACACGPACSQVSLGAGEGRHRQALPGPCSFERVDHTGSQSVLPCRLDEAGRPCVDLAKSLRATAYSPSLPLA